MPRHVSCKLHAVASNSANERLDGFFDDLVRCETRLYNVLGERLRAAHGIVTSQFELLRYLRDHPRSRVADIAANFAGGIGAISKSVDRLEARGWVARLPNPADGRSSLISLTASGAALTAAAEQTFREQLRQLVGTAISPGQVDAAGAALAALRRALEQAHIGLPVGLVDSIHLLRAPRTARTADRNGPTANKLGCEPMDPTDDREACRPLIPGRTNVADRSKILA